MDFKQLIALVTVAEVGSVTKAAQVLHLVQPAVTRQIRALEEELGVNLFERTRHGMVATTAGARLVERAHRALLELERARAELRSTPEQVRGIVTLGLLESTIELVAPALLEAVAEAHPGIELRLLSAYSGHLQEWLDEGAVDLSLLYDLTNSETLSVVPLLRERLWAIAPPGTGLDKHIAVPWERLREQPMVLPVPGHGLRTLVDRALAVSEVAVHRAVETNSMFLQKRIVESGQGWTVLPAAGVVRDVESGRFSGAPLSDPEVSRSIALAVPRGNRTPLHVEAVASELVRVVRALVRSGAWLGAELAERAVTQGD